MAAITSCTNTSNPEVMIAAGLLAKKAIEQGLTVPNYVKTSFSPGSRVVVDYLKAAGLQSYLDQLGFQVVGYGCMTCIGNSGQLKEVLQVALTKNEYPLSAIESGNRNFEGRVNPLIKDTYLASPPLVVAYALTGTLDINLEKEPLGYNSQGKAIFLKDIWPSQEEISQTIHNYLIPELFSENYDNIFIQNKYWNQLKATKSLNFDWQEKSTYIAAPPLFDESNNQLQKSKLAKACQSNQTALAKIDIQSDDTNLLDDLFLFTDLRVLAKLGDSITTDHISPAGFIGQKTPAGNYLLAHGIAPKDFNSYGARRGNHEVMMRGTLANIRLHNQLTPEVQGGFTKDWLTGKVTNIYEAAMDYKKHQIGSIILAGKDYGMGSSRDWAAKGISLLGVQAVIAESFERIHRSNLVMMGVLPLEYLFGETADSLGLTGEETFDIKLVGKIAYVSAKTATKITEFKTKVRFDAPIDVAYFTAGGILPYVIHKKLAK